MNDGAIGVDLHLDRLHDLFTAPALDPLRGRVQLTSGVDQVVELLRARRLRSTDRLVLTVVLPPHERVDPVRVQDAVRVYCDAVITRSERHRRIVGVEGASTLRSELVLIPLLALAAALLLAFLPDLPTQVIAVLSPIVTITVWVALWNPVDSLLFDRRAESRSIRVHRLLRDAEIRLPA